MAGWFELSKSTDDQFRFVLKADNAQTILTSQQYAARDSAEGGIASVQANCSEDSRYERKTSSDGKAFFNLKAANHQVIGTSQMYSSESARETRHRQREGEWHDQDCQGQQLTVRAAVCPAQQRGRQGAGARSPRWPICRAVGRHGLRRPLQPPTALFGSEE